VGLKPTYGLLPAEGIFPLAYTMDHVGPMARTVEDVACLFKALPDSRSRALLEEKYRSRNEIAKGKIRRLEGVRAGILKDHVIKELCHEAIWKGYQEVLKAAEDEGAKIVEIAFPDFDAVYTTALILTLAQASQIHRTRMADHPGGFGEDVRLLLEAGYLVSAVDYVQAQKVRAKLIETALLLTEKTECWVMPTTPNPAIPVGGTDLTIALNTAHSR
jgi:aspartyl-tRNA(Asn)/glutamyl-tRNA(Gln) amidotransferase subunit A